MAKWIERTKLLLGNESLEKLKKTHVLVVGLGGVGAMAAEQIVRAGIGFITIIDADSVEETNINRQMPALHSTIGKTKADILAERLLDINPELNINSLKEYLRTDRIIEVLETPFDYVVDAIDTLSPKVYLIYRSIEKNIPIVSSMGSGGKLNPALISVVDINKTYNCKLARMVRKRLHKLGVKKGVKVVFSPENVDKEAVTLEQGTNKASNVGTISYMPNMFGCYCASVVIRDLIDK